MVVNENPHVQEFQKNSQAWREACVNSIKGNNVIQPNINSLQRRRWEGEKANGVTVLQAPACEPLQASKAWDEVGSRVATTAQC